MARSSAVYRSLTRLYPSAFRAAYGDDLVALFEQQRRDVGTWSVWMRTVRDLTVSVPAEHVDVLVHRSPYDFVATSAMALVVTGMVVAVVTGHPVAIVCGAAIAIVGSLLARWSWRVGRPVRSRGDVTGVWWVCVGAGLACVATGMVIASGTHQDFGRFFWPWLVVSLTGVTLVAFGALLGLVHAIGFRHRRPVGSVG